MSVFGAFLVLAVFTVVLVPLAMTGRRSLVVLTLQGVAAAGVVLSLGLFFFRASGEPERVVNVTTAGGARVPAELTAAERAARTEAAVRWIPQAVGCWVGLLAASELLRVMLKRPAGVEALGPAVGLLAGVVLFSPGWAAALGFVTLTAGAVAVAVWRPATASGPAASPGREGEAAGP